MNSQNIIKAGICWFVLGVFAFQTTGLADGVVYKSTKDSPYFSMVREDRQVAYINYVNGVQHMIISVVAGFESGKEEDIKDIVWIFPLPAKPEDVSIDIVKDFRMFHEGLNVETKVMDNKRRWAGFTLTSQVFPAPLLLLFPLFRVRNVELDRSMNFLDGKGSITEYMSVRKMGLITKVITATEGESFYNYIKEKGAEIPEEAKSTFQAYIGKNYSFVVSWVDNVQEYIGNLKGNDKKVQRTNHVLQVYVKFKTDEIYYPMLLTSLYGQEIIGVSLYFAIPVVFSSEGSGRLVYYYLNNKHEVPPEYVDFYGKEYYGDCVYTLYTGYNDFASNIKSDLWFKEGKPKNLDRSIFFIRYFWPLFILCYAFFSAISSLLAGYIVFNNKETKPSNLRLLGLGLFNCLTLIGLVLAGNRMFRKNVPAELNELVSKLKDEGIAVSINPARKFYIWFSFIFMFFMLGFEIVILGRFLY